MESIPSLVTTAWLAEQMKLPEWKKSFRLLDCTWDLPKAKRDFIQEHNNCRIPGAKYFSLSECRNKEAKLPNTMPTASYFQQYVQELSIHNGHHLILYDNSERFGLFSAPRVWWLFNLFGHSKVSILDGGLPKWKKDGCETASGPYSDDETFQSTDQKFKAEFNGDLVRDLAFMKSNLENGSVVQVLDARPNGRYRGVEPEPRPDIPSGHIPQSTSIPFFTNFNRETNVLLPAEEIKKRLLDAVVDLEKPIVFTCGSGITACDLAFAVFVATGKRFPLFDDSWFGWQTNTPDELQIREEKK